MITFLRPFRMLCAIFSVIAAIAEGAGPGFSRQSWETDEGLPHNGVNAIHQRHDGFLWVATQGGLTRFDGVEFVQHWSPLLTNPKSSRVLELIDENPETLLIACDTSGLVRWRDGVFSVHPVGGEIGDDRRILSLHQEADDVFWVVTEDREALRWDRGRVERFPPAENGKAAVPGSFATDGRSGVFIARGNGVERYARGGLSRVPEIPDNAVTIAPSADGGLWGAGSAGLWRWDGGHPAQVAAGTPWSGAPPNAMLEDADGSVWLATKMHGLFRCTATAFQQVGTSHPRMTALFRDREGSIWAGTTGGGLNLIKRARFQVLGESAGWTPDIEGSVCEGEGGRLWFANSGVGLRVVRGGEIQPRPDLPDWPGKAVPVAPGKDGHVWVGSGDRIGRIGVDLTRAPEWVSLGGLGKVHVIHVARDGTVWVGGEGGLLASMDGLTPVHFGESDGYTGIQAQAVCEDAAGDIWVGTEEGRLFRGRGGRFVEQDLPAELRGSGIRTLVGDRDGIVWAGTGGGGLLVGKGGRFAVIAEEHGLPDSVISHLLEDDFGALWFGTARALYKVAKSELLACAEGRVAGVVPVKYGAADGLPGFSAAANYQPGAWKARDGRLLFVSRKGLVIADPGPGIVPRESPRVSIERLSIDGKPAPPGAAMPPSSARKLEFHFTAPTFLSPEKVRYRYRLDPFDTGWNDAGTQRSAVYSRLDPGRYHFEVAASNGDLGWTSAVTRLPVEIVPAWWETWWARTLGSAALVVLLVMAVRYWSHQRLKARLSELEATRRVDLERSRIARDLHDGLGAGLTQIGMMAEELAEDIDEPDEMKIYSSRIAGRVRGIARDLDAAVWTVSPQHDTLPALSSYLCQYAIEYFRDTPIRCRVEVARDIPGTPLSPDARHHLFLTAKEVMNNALKHSGARHLDLSLGAGSGVFRMEFRDDGHGFPEGENPGNGGHGLRNIRERVMELGGCVDIRSASAGTSVSIELPLPN